MYNPTINYNTSNPQGRESSGNDLVTHGNPPRISSADHRPLVRQTSAARLLDGNRLSSLSNRVIPERSFEVPVRQEVTSNAERTNYPQEVQRSSYQENQSRISTNARPYIQQNTVEPAVRNSAPVYADNAPRRQSEAQNPYPVARPLQKQESSSDFFSIRPVTREVYSNKSELLTDVRSTVDNERFVQRAPVENKSAHRLVTDQVQNITNTTCSVDRPITFTENRTTERQRPIPEPNSENHFTQKVSITDSSRLEAIQHITNGRSIERPQTVVENRPNERQRPTADPVPANHYAKRVSAVTESSRLDQQFSSAPSRTAQRQLPLDPPLENRPRQVEHIDTRLLENSIRPVNNNQPIQRPPENSERPFTRQRSSAALHQQVPPASYKPPEAGGETKPSFRQLVTRQLLPPRNPERLPSESVQDGGMGQDHSRILKSSHHQQLTSNSGEPNRLIKLAQTEMSDVNNARNETVNIQDRNAMSNDKSFVKIDPPQQRRMAAAPPENRPHPDSNKSYVAEPVMKSYSEHQPTRQFSMGASSELENKVPDIVQRDQPKIMPSGKPVAKEVTITVTGKLPSQPPPVSNNVNVVRGKPNEDSKSRYLPTDQQRPLATRSPQMSTDSFDDSRRGDPSYISMDPTKRPELNRGPSYGPVEQQEIPDRVKIPVEMQRNDSSSNVLYRQKPDIVSNEKPVADTKRSYESPEYSETVRNSNESPATTETYARSADYKRMTYDNSATNRTVPSEQEMVSLAYIPTDRTEAPDTARNIERPSELNLSSSDKKYNRVAWKNSEDTGRPLTSEKKSSGRNTPTGGVSFAETPVSFRKTPEGKVPGTWCALTGRFIPLEQPRSPEPPSRPKTPTTPRKKKLVGTYCSRTGRYIPPEAETPDGRKTPDFRVNSEVSTPDGYPRRRAMTPRGEEFHVSFMDDDHEEEYSLRKTSESGRLTPSYVRRVPKKPNIAFGSVVPDFKPSERRRVRRTKSFNDCIDRRHTDGDHDSGVDEATQGHAATNGDVKSAGSRRSAPTKIPSHKRASTPGTGNASPVSSPLKSPNKPHPPRSASLTPDPTVERKKLPMNKVQVGTAASPNLKVVRSKIGSLENATHKPGGGQVRIENHKVEFKNAAPRIAAKNDTYQPGGGDKKIESKKLQWNAKSKIGSLENATHKAGGGDKKIESQKVDFKDKAKSKVGSKDNMKHSPGGGNIKIENQKLDFKERVGSKVGSLANVTHKPGGGDVKIFDDKEYLRQMSNQPGSTDTHSKASSEGHQSGTQSPMPTSPPPGLAAVPSPMSPTSTRS